MLYIEHFFACCWIMIGTEEYVTTTDGWVGRDLYDGGGSKIYLNAFYFVVTTMTTVGYGDVSAGTMVEQIFCIALMMFGVFVFSMITGSLTSLLGSVDSETAELTEKLMFLNKITTHYHLPHNICSEIRKTLNDSAMELRGLHEFVESLPP